jgi:hypothetical protein
MSVWRTEVKTALRTIGNDVYVAGMLRQAYRRRMAGGLWESANNGVLDTSLDRNAITGFWTNDTRNDEIWLQASQSRGDVAGSAARLEEEVVVADKGCRVISLFAAGERPLANTC